MFKKISFIALSWYTLFSASAFAQDHALDHSIKGKLGVTAVMGHAFIKHNLEHEKSNISSAAAFGLDVNYWLTNRWAVGVHSDMVFENFIVEEKKGTKENNFLEREYPVSVNAIAMFKPIHSLGLLAGGGREFAKEKNLTMFLAGAEYMFELPNDWELGVSATYEAKRHAYDTVVLGLGVTHLFSFERHHKH